MPHAATSRQELGLRVGAWLLELIERGHSSIDVAYDYHADFDLLERALKDAGLWERLKNVLRPTHIGYLIGQDDIEAAIQTSWEKSCAADGVDRHHALADARALCAGFLRMHSGQEDEAEKWDGAV